MHSTVKKSDLDLENKKLSKKCLLEKLDNHVKKLVEETEKNTSDFQKSFQSLLTSMDACRNRAPCKSMQDYFQQIQELNNHFDDLEDKSSHFVENIYQLRVKSLIIDGLKESDDAHDSSPITETPQLQFNGNSVGLFQDNSTEIDNDEVIKISNDDNESTSEEESFNKDEDQLIEEFPKKKIEMHELNHFKSLPYHDAQESPEISRRKRYQYRKTVMRRNIKD